MSMVLHGEQALHLGQSVVPPAGKGTVLAWVITMHVYVYHFPSDALIHELDT